jgi:hypothetical protein
MAEALADALQEVGVEAGHCRSSMENGWNRLRGTVDLKPGSTAPITRGFPFRPG